MKEAFVGLEAYSESFQTSKMKLFEKIVTMNYFQSQSATLLKEVLHLNGFCMKFANFFRSAILQHTSEETYFEDTLALYEMAEPK